MKLAALVEAFPFYKKQQQKRSGEGGRIEAGKVECKNIVLMPRALTACLQIKRDKFTVLVYSTPKRLAARRRGCMALFLTRESLAVRQLCFHQLVKKDSPVDGLGLVEISVLVLY